MQVLRAAEQFEQKYNRTLPFTYIFKGLSEYQLKNYV